MYLSTNFALVTRRFVPLRQVSTGLTHVKVLIQINIAIYCYLSFIYELVESKNIVSYCTEVDILIVVLHLKNSDSVDDVLKGIIVTSLARTISILHNFAV